MSEPRKIRRPPLFWATRPGTPARLAEEKLARELELNLREAKPLEATLQGILDGQGDDEPKESTK